MPQVCPSHGTPTRSPTAKPATSAPIAATRPTISWPGTIGSFGSGNSPSTTCRSVRHTPQAATSTRISPAPGVGIGCSRNTSGVPGRSSTMARMLAMAVQTLVGADARVPQDLAVALGFGPDHGIELFRRLRRYYQPLRLHLLSDVGQVKHA